VQVGTKLIWDPQMTDDHVSKILASACKHSYNVKLQTGGQKHNSSYKHS